MSLNDADKKAREVMETDYQDARVAATNALQSIVAEINDSEPNHSASMTNVWASDAVRVLVNLGGMAEVVRTFDWLHRNDF